MLASRICRSSGRMSAWEETRAESTHNTACRSLGALLPGVRRHGFGKPCLTWLGCAPHAGRCLWRRAQHGSPPEHEAQLPGSAERQPSRSIPRSLHRFTHARSWRGKKKSCGALPFAAARCCCLLPRFLSPPAHIPTPPPAIGFYPLLGRRTAYISLETTPRSEGCGVWALRAAVVGHVGGLGRAFAVLQEPDGVAEARAVAGSGHGEGVGKPGQLVLGRCDVLAVQPVQRLDGLCVCF